MKRKVFIFAILLLVFGWLIWAKTYTFDVQSATTHLTEHGLKKSKSWCAWYTMRALQAGGCPAILLPAQWYSWFMPFVGFNEVEKDGYKPQAGDVVVFERPKWLKHHLWGHVAMYNGQQWISDFKQKRMSPYKRYVPYKIFRYK